MKNKVKNKEQETTEIPQFKDFSLDSELIKKIEEKGFQNPTGIQQKSIPLILEEKKDIIGIAQTGTGKTAAFGLPLMTKINSGNKNPNTIILSPTRELALQITRELNTYHNNKFRILTVYGGQNISIQLKELKKGNDIIVGTPGRVIDLLNRKALNLSKAEYVVLDEADEMLKMGFIEDVETILSHLKKDRRIYLYSATIPEPVKKLTQKYMKNQEIIKSEKKTEIPKNINQYFYKTKASEKLNLLTQLIDNESFFYGIIFCKTKKETDELTKALKKHKLDADCIHGDINQSKREKTLEEFRKQKLNILVATDVAARGIDVDDLTHVINHSFPQEIETYLHRIGRTARAGKKGTAITLVSPKETGKISMAEKTFNIKIHKGSLPSREEIQQKRKENTLNKVRKSIKNDTEKKNKELAGKLLEEYPAEEVISGLLSNYS